MNKKLVVKHTVSNDKKIFAVTTPDKLGNLPQRNEVEVEIFDNVNKIPYDIIGWEQIGYGIFNKGGVAIWTPPKYYELSCVRNEGFRDIYLSLRRLRSRIFGPTKGDFHATT